MKWGGKGHTKIIPSNRCLNKARTTHHDVKVHTKDTDSRIVSGTKVDVLLDTETEVTGLRDCLRPTDSDVDSNLLVTTDTECTDGVAGFRGDGCLTAELFEDFGRTGKTITRLANTDGDMETDLQINARRMVIARSRSPSTFSNAYAAIFPFCARMTTSSSFSVARAAEAGLK
jgi:hypothetical protein